MSANNAERGKSKPQVLQSQQKSKPDLLNLPISTQGFPWAISSLSPLRYPHSKSQVQGIRPELHLAWDLVWQTLLTMLHPRSSLYIIIHIYIYIHIYIHIWLYMIMEPSTPQTSPKLYKFDHPMQSSFRSSLLRWSAQSSQSLWDQRISFTQLLRSVSWRSSPNICPSTPQLRPGTWGLHPALGTLERI